MNKTMTSSTQAISSDGKSTIQEVIPHSINRRGKSIQYWVTCTSFLGVILVMEEEQGCE